MYLEACNQLVTSHLTFDILAEVETVKQLVFITVHTNAPPLGW